MGAVPATAACRDDQVEVRWPGGLARFSVEVADTEATRSRGLMFRESMPQSSGMLFVYDSPRRATFWMKNTLIPLDMIFADPAGRVTKVHANAKPQDVTTIDGGEGVKFVLEINGGLAARLGIPEGAELRHPAITDPAWPCAE
ncbi:DUF192 domain-containing protein [Rhodobacter sp. ETT8]|uniref:DUF192 domain-containing protein n=1 Tax=Pseudotabrizicola algicola TaxID=2709381 RepID=A0A6B3RLV1_9RHOB|nr:DUF192 domain-containing protein [Pseudotabrizicola algicola]NEX45808.1 DUF192 domain-containing protein [Pseudotabrizicola algicola]